MASEEGSPPESAADPPIETPEDAAEVSPNPGPASPVAATPAPQSASSAAPVSVAQLRVQLEKLVSEASITVAGISIGAGFSGFLFGTGNKPSPNASDEDGEKPSNSAVRDAAKAALEDLKKREESKDPELTAEGAADRYWAPFKMACHPEQPDRLQNAAVGCIQRLVAFRLLKGQPAPPEGTPASPTQASKGVTVEEVVLTIAECFDGPATDDSLQLNILKCLLTISTTPSVSLHSSALLTAIQTVINIYSNTRNTVNQMTARGALTQMLNNIFSKAEAQDQTYRQLIKQDASNPDPQLKADMEVLAAQSQLLKADIATVFRILSKLSMFSESPVAALTPEDLPIAVLRCRTIALESCLTILRQGVTSSWFRTDPSIVGSIQKTLCLSLSRNAVVTDSALFELGISVFLLLVAGWRTVLKREIEVLLVNIYLYILEMGNAATQQKLVVLQCLSKIVGESQVMADLYVNYDCEIGREGLFEKIVEVCGRVAQGLGVSGNMGPDGLKPNNAGSAQNPSGPASEDERKLKRQGLRSLVSVVESLVEWSKSVAASPISAGGTTPATTKDLEMSVTSFDQPRDGRGTSEVHGKIDGAPVLLLKNPLSVITRDADIPYIYPEANDGNGEANGEGSGSTSGDNQDGAGSGDPQPEQQATRKQQLREAVQLFNTKPRKGLKQFVETGFVPSEEPAALVSFLRDNPSIGLTKSAIGELLGEGDPESVKIMHAWVDSMDFAGLAFVEALRSFLQTFRLPGEAQKIDRIMEKFADRFLECNPDSFASADTAYTLAYSCIMLNVDQHSVKVKNKMDKPAFIRNNRGINSGADLPEALLSSIFDDISGNEIVLEEEREEAERNKREKAVDERERNDMYKREMAQMQKKSQALMMQKSAKSAGRSPLTSSSTAMSKATEEGQLVFRPATNPDLARSMFKTACWPFLAAFSLMFENEGSLEDAAGNLEDGAAQAKFDAQIWDIAAGKVAGAKGRAAASADGSISSVALSLRGMAGCVRVAGIFKLETERNAFVSSLAKMTCLSKVPEMRARNVKAVKTLITMASVIGEYLDSSWLDVLKCISLLERTQLIEARSAFGVGPDPEQPAARSIQTQPSLLQSIFDGDDDTVSDGSSPRLSSGGAQGKSSFSGAVVLPSDQSKAASLDLLVKQIQSQDTLVAIDRIFSSTVQLSGTGVQAFFRSLCEVSAEEVGISPEYVAASIKPLSETTGIQSQPSILVSATPSSSSLSSLFSTGGSGARMYSLQKVVEVAYYNMFRIRYEFSAIWRILQPHFNIMGCHPDPIVATFAVDALRQLSMKFLERDELSHYNTQSDFLRSFEHIMRNSSNLTIKDLITQSFKQMIAARAKNIRSGWRSIWSVLSKAAHESHPALVKNAFSVTQLVYQDAVETVVAGGGFAEYIGCLKEFAQAGQRAESTTGNRLRKPVGEEVVIGSIRLLQGCASKLLELGPAAKVSSTAIAGMMSRRDSFYVKDSPDPGVGSLALDEPTLTPEEHHVAGGPTNGASEEQFYLMWFPILSALSRVVIDHTSAVVRGEATEALFAVLKQSGHLFDLSMWRNIRRSVILPIFEGLGGNTDGEDDGDGPATGALAQWAAAPTSEEAAIWVQALRELVDLASALFLRLPEPLELVRSVLDLVVPMIGRRNENLASTGAICLQRFLKDIISKLSERPGAWELVTDALERAFDVSMPRDLLFWQYKETPKAVEVASKDREAVVLSVETDAGGELGEQIMSPVPETPVAEAFASLDRAGTPSNDRSQTTSQSSPVGATRSPGRRPPLKRKPTLVLDFDSVIVRAAVHLELIQSARDAALTEYVSPLAVRVASGTVLASDGIRDEDAQSTISTTHSGQGIREAASGSIAGGVPGAIPLPQCAALAMAPAAVRGRWLQLFRDSYAFAYAFNQDVDRRTAIFRRGFVPQLPNLSKQEVVSCTSLVRTMFALYMRNGDEEFVEMAAEPAWLAEARASEIPIEYLPSGDGAFLGGLTGDGAVVRVELAVCLISLVNSVLSRFVEQGKDQRRHAKELGQWAPLVAAIYRDLSVFVETHHRRGEGEEDRFGGFRRSVAGFFKLGIQLIHVDKAEVRWALERFMESISGLISLA